MPREWKQDAVSDLRRARFELLNALRNRPEPCRLCGNKLPLRESHIFPDFYVRRMQHKVPMGESGQEQPHLILRSSRADVKDGARRRGRWEKEIGIKEFLLCDNCEQKLSKFETYARTLLYGNGPEPIAKIELGKSIATKSSFMDAVFLDVRRVTGINYKMFKLYQLSLLWRAGVATGDFFQNVCLGERHEKKLRNLLLNEDPGKATDYCCGMIDLRWKGKGCEDFTHQPDCGRDEETKQRIYKMILGGYVYVFHVTNEPPSEAIATLAVGTAGEMTLLVAGAQNILSYWSDLLKKAGKL